MDKGKKTRGITASCTLSCKTLPLQASRSDVPNANKKGQLVKPKPSPARKKTGTTSTQ